MSEPEITSAASRINLPIEWHIPEGVRTRYASHVLVQAGQFEIVLSFFEIQLPILLGQPEENQAKLQAMGGIRAECVGRMILPPEQAATLIPALETTVKAYWANKDANGVPEATSEEEGAESSTDSEE